MVQRPGRIVARFPRRPQPVPRILRRFSMTRDRPAVTPERLEKAAKRLRPAEREVLVLSARELLSNDEIALRLGIEPREAQRLLAKALLRLDRALARQDRPWWRLW